MITHMLADVKQEEQKVEALDLLRQFLEGAWVCQIHSLLRNLDCRATSTTKTVSESPKTEEGGESGCPTERKLYLRSDSRVKC